ncbi:MAG: hypothetical protein Q8O38_16265, partial [Sulfurimicrobium sp.]|nr:hypothetical protein [Sulfurimicrobium sp.]
LTQAQAGATVNEAEGWVQNLNGANIQNALTGYQTQVKSYIDSAKPNATVGDVLGSKTIIQKNYSILMGTLQYKTLAVGSRMASLPDSLRHTVTIRLFDSDIGKALDNPVMELNIPLSKLGTRRLGVTYVAASPADQAIIDSYKAQGAKSLPAYLIHMKGQLKLDQQVLAETPAGTMGAVQWWMARFYDPSGINSTDDDFKVESAIGDENVFGFNLAGLTETAVHARQDSIPNESAGETLHLTSLYYWAWQDARHSQLAKSQGIVNYRIPSVGLFAQQVNSTYFFGIPRSAYYLGRLMDIRRSITTLAAPDQTTSVNFMREIGIFDSYFEGAVFDVLYGHELGASASAVSLLSEANQQGIKIYQINSGNAGSVLPRLQLDQSIKDDIANAVAAGLVVEAPERNVQHGSLLGAGYIITDPVTGSGTYLVKGGANGGVEDACDGEQQTEPSPKPIAKLSWIQNLFFIVALLVIGAVVIANAPVIGGFALLLGAGSAANAGILDAPLDQLKGLSKLTWDSTFGQVYGQWPNAAADKLPSSCDPVTEQSLGEGMHAICDNLGPSCNQPHGIAMGCTNIDAAMDKASACVQARLTVMQTCYPGGAAGFGNAAHWGAVRDVVNRLARCACQKGVEGCP